MNDTIKNSSPAEKGDSPSKERGKKKEDSEPVKIYKLPSHKDNKCILMGIDEQRQKDFNTGNPISVTREELKIIGNYRWLGVE